MTITGCRALLSKANMTKPFRLSSYHSGYTGGFSRCPVPAYTSIMASLDFEFRDAQANVETRVDFSTSMSQKMLHPLTCLVWCCYPASRCIATFHRMHRSSLRCCILQCTEARRTSIANLQLSVPVSVVMLTYV